MGRDKSMSSKKVLIVDDEPHLMLSITYVLQKEGYMIDSAVDGEEALQKVRESKPDLMFLDVMMPRKDGYEVCREIKASPELKDIYVIMLSAKGQASDREEGLKAGADDFVTKPFSPMAIVAKVKKILG
jgi:DNA-binding response OmpR family regulator